MAGRVGVLGHSGVGGGLRTDAWRSAEQGHQSDRQCYVAAITAAMELSSFKLLMNSIAGELALRLESLRCSIAMAEHIPGLLNFVADALSRLEAGKSSQYFRKDRIRHAEYALLF